ncbi:MAG: fructosamine kinase family protein, partial [Pirellulales bacterium]|nr:fructosamine kinase family protein [Pirellulales bacterium]
MRTIQAALSELTATSLTVTATSSVGGGCISDANCVSIRDDQGEVKQWFVKRNGESFLSNFQCEWDGLSQLGATAAIAVPEPIAVGVWQGQAWLVTGWVERGRADGKFFADFGQRLARLHRQTQGSRIGWERDNYLGAAIQPNGPAPCWVDFVAQRRIGYQLRWAVDQRLASAALKADCERVMAQMDQCLEGRPESTSLLHGDLWSGNYLCDVRGQPVLMDPAVYFGCREAEFGMIQLFGGCPQVFYHAYQSTFPLADGWQRRVT